MLFNVKAWTKFLKVGNLSTFEGPRATSIMSLGVAQVEPECAEMARAGRRFTGGTSIIANGIAPVAAIPTTTATLALVNKENSGSGKTIYIDGVVFYLGSGVPAAGATLFMTISPGPIATAPVTQATGYAVASCSGSTQASKALFASAVTIPAGAAWFPVISNSQLAAANVGMGQNPVLLRGQFAVPPGYAVGFGILSGAGTTPLYGIGMTWAEIENSGELE